MVVTDTLSEKARDRLLRRADWRFLLSTPQPKKSICFADGVLREAVSLISGSVINPQTGSPGDCDLAVAINPSDTTLRAAWSGLHPDGSFYTEWYSPFYGGAKAVRRRLEAAGFAHISCYWPWPWYPVFRPRFWLPLESPRVVRYFLTTRPPARALIRRVSNSGLRWFWRLSHHLRLTVPVCALARKPPVSSVKRSLITKQKLRTDYCTLRAAELNTDLLGMIRTQWTEWGLGPTPDHLSSLMLTGGPRTISKIVRLVFARSDHRPALAIKMPRVPESVPGLFREAKTLHFLQSLGLGGVRGVPGVLFCEEQAGVLAVGETVLTGRLISRLLRPHNYREFALQATGWLASFAKQTQNTPSAVWQRQLIESVIADFKESFGPVLDTGMLRETEHVLATLRELPLVCEQRDFGPWNVLVKEDGELGVLDWESSELRGLPALDLLYFLSYLAFHLDGAMESRRFRESYRASLNSATLTGGVRSECLALYSKQVGLDPAADLHPLRLLVWLIHSRSDYQHFKADVAAKPHPELLRRSLFLSLWEEELRYATKLSQA
jgi:aminoglycoside phosphotransferase (APT) family kinase protein